MNYTPDGQFLFAADLGTDKLYRFDANDTPFEGQPALRESSYSEWSYPRDRQRYFDFHPDGGHFMYLLGELSGEVIVFGSPRTLQQKQVTQADSLSARGAPISTSHLTAVSCTHPIAFRVMGSLFSPSTRGRVR